jgi:hypothetical protein
VSTPRRRHPSRSRSSSKNRCSAAGNRLYIIRCPTIGISQSPEAADVQEVAVQQPKGPGGDFNLNQLVRRRRV